MLPSFRILVIYSYLPCSGILSPIKLKSYSIAGCLAHSLLFCIAEQRVEIKIYQEVLVHENKQEQILPL